MLALFKRVLSGPAVQDPSTIAAHTYNEAAGAQKNTEVGRHLLAIGDGASGYTTNATTARKIPRGKCLAVYNNANAVGSITLGDDAVALVSQAPGAVQANTNGRSVGIACAPNDWTYIACAEQTQVIASAATLLVYMIDDSSTVAQESTR
jgi:hypothetical protein